MRIRNKVQENQEKVGVIIAMIPQKNNPIAEASNKFAFDIYEVMIKKNENLFFSPISISSALAMVFTGAKEETANQMNEVLEYTLHPKKLHVAYESFLNELNFDNGNPDIELTLANALWIQKDYKLLESFTYAIKTHYNGALYNIDFSNVGDALAKINNWSNTQTKGKIKEILKKVYASNRLVLTNAIYFLGKWKKPFKEEDTKNEKFTLASGETKIVPLMYQKSPLYYMEQPTYQILKIPYKGTRLSMVVFLPKNEKGFAEMEKKLTAEKIVDFSTKFENQTVEAYIPKFCFSETLELSSILKELGMKEAFTRNANFSGIDGSTELFISSVIHKAYVDVTEVGTEAAAVTAVVMLAKGMPVKKIIPVFRADHPFLFVIFDEQTRAILFFGRVMNPKKSI